MTSRPCLLDSDILSELSRGHAQVERHARRYIEERGRLTISAVTVFERLRGYRAAIDAGKPFGPQLEAFEQFSAACHVLPVDGLVADCAATYWAKLPVRKRQALGDILIAATARVSDLVLITRNRRDFSPIAKIDVRLALGDWSR